MLKNEARNFESQETHPEIDSTLLLLANYFSSDDFSLFIPDFELPVQRNFDTDYLLIIIAWVEYDDLGCFIPKQLCGTFD